MRTTAVLAALCLATVALATTPTASASVEDLCDNLSPSCSSMYYKLKDACLQLGFNNEVCSGDACDLVLSSSTCSSLRAYLYASCMSGGYLGQTTCTHVSQTPT